MEGVDGMEGGSYDGEVVVQFAGCTAAGGAEFAGACSGEAEDYEGEEYRG